MPNTYQENKKHALAPILSIFTGFLDILYPRHCFACDKSLHEEKDIYICKTCSEKINNVEIKRCIKCGSELGPSALTTIKGCPECVNANLRFERSFFVSNYDDPLRKLIHQYKYNKHECLARPFGDLLINQLLIHEIISEIDIVVPVPLHWRKKLERGFNQSELIAKRICKKLSLPISINNLCRIKNTLSQTQLPRAQRQKNVSGAFRIKQPKVFIKKQMLLVDDVLTTGITASECARNLKKAGAKKVYLLALARAKL